MDLYATLSGAAFTGPITVNGNTPLYSIPNTVAMLSGAAFTGAITVNGDTPLYSIPNTVAMLSGAAFTGAITVNGNTPLYSIPNTYAPLNNASFTGSWNLYTSAGRNIELGVDSPNCCYIDFHSCDANSSGVDYDSRIISSGGNSSGGGGTLDYLATNHNFHGTLSLNGNTVATTNQIPSLNDVQNQLNYKQLK